MGTRDREAADAALGRERWECFLEQGYLLLGRTCSTQRLHALQSRIDDLMLGRLPAEQVMMQLDLGGDYEAMAAQTLGSKGHRRDYRKIEGLERDPVFLDYLQRPLFRLLCDLSHGRQDIAVYRAMVMNKPARKGTLLPWHQDGGAIWGLDRDPQLTVWTALDDATTENGCVQIIPGSHRLGLLSPRPHHHRTPDQAALPSRTGGASRTAGWRGGGLAQLDPAPQRP